MAIQDYNPDFYEEAFKFRLNSVYSELKPLVEQSCFIYAGLHPSHTILTRPVCDIVKQIDEAYSSGKRIIFFDSCDESYTDSSALVMHEASVCAKEKYPDISCIVIFGSVHNEEEYLSMCEKYETIPSLEILSCNFFERVAKDQYEHFVSYFDLHYSLAPRSKIFTCLNRVLRMHRFHLLNQMLSENLVNDNCYYSFYDSSIEGGNLGEISNYCNDSRFSHIIANYDIATNLRLNFDEERINPADLRKEDFYLYHDSYFSVVPETMYYNSDRYPDFARHCIFFSEKTYKPIVLLQPFILVGCAGSLNALRERGFRTFHPYIDETYDTIKDDELRMEAVVKEVKRLSNKSEREWLEWMQSVKPILEFNLTTLNSHTSYIGNKDLIDRLKII